MTPNLVTFPTPSTAFYQLSFRCRSPLQHPRLHPPLSVRTTSLTLPLERGPRNYPLSLTPQAVSQTFFSPLSQSLSHLSPLNPTGFPPDRRPVKIATSLPTASGFFEKFTFRYFGLWFTGVFRLDRAIFEASSPPSGTVWPASTVEANAFGPKNEGKRVLLAFWGAVRQMLRYASRTITRI